MRRSVGILSRYTILLEKYQPSPIHGGGHRMLFLNSSRIPSPLQAAPSW